MNIIKRHYLRNKGTYEVIGECLGLLVSFAVFFAICWLCCVCSGYHWE